MTSIGRVMRAFNINTGSEVAIKQMPRTNVDDLHIPALKYEAMVHALIPDGTEGFPSIHYAGPDANQYVIVMDRLGPSLGGLLRVCRGTFTFRTTCMLADQMVRYNLVHISPILCCAYNATIRSGSSSGFNFCTLEGWSVAISNHTTSQWGLTGPRISSTSSISRMQGRTSIQRVAIICHSLQATVSLEQSDMPAWQRTSRKVCPGP